MDKKPLCTTCKYFRNYDNVCSKFGIERTSMGELKIGCWEEIPKKNNAEIVIYAKNIINDGKISSIGSNAGTKITTENYRGSGTIEAKSNSSLENNRDDEILKLNPEIYGIGINLRLLWKKLFSKFSKR